MNEEPTRDEYCRMREEILYLDPEYMLHGEELCLRLGVLCDQALDCRVEWSWLFCLGQHAPCDPPYAHLFAVGEWTFRPSSIYGPLSVTTISNSRVSNENKVR